MKNNSSVFLSIIVPVYNTPIEDLTRCFFSLENQSCKEFELIVVDDGSAAEVAKYLDGLFTSFERIRIEHINHCGVSATRNWGLGLVSTPYVAFSDSDDEYSLDFVKEAKEYVEKYNPDIVYGTISFVPKVDLVQTDSLVHFFNKVDEIKEVYKAFLGISKNTWGLRVYPSQCARVFLASLVCSVKFDEQLSCGEDQIFNRKCLAKAKSILMVPNDWYIYYTNDYSATHQKEDFLFQIQKPFYDAFCELNKLEKSEMKKELCVPQYKSFFSIMSYDIVGNRRNKWSSTRKCKSFLQKKALLDESLSHPYFATAFEGLRGSHDIGFADRVFVYLVNHRMYRLLIFCCRIVIIFRRFKRKLQRQERF